MEKKQARYGKSGGQQSSSQTSSNSGKKKSVYTRRNRGSIHENFEWGFVSGGEDSDFDDTSRRNSSEPASDSGGQRVKKRPSAAPATKERDSETPSAKSPSPERGQPERKKKSQPARPASPSKVQQQSTLFDVDDMDDDLSLPSYGRTPHVKTATQITTPARDSVVASPEKRSKQEKSEPTERTKRPVKETPISPKKIIAKPPQRGSAAPAPRNPESMEPKTPAADKTIERPLRSEGSSRKKAKLADSQYTTIPPLPRRERQRWDPEKREYIVDKEPAPQPRAEEERQTRPANRQKPAPEAKHPEKAQERPERSAKSDAPRERSESKPTAKRPPQESKPREEKAPPREKAKQRPSEPKREPKQPAMPRGVPIEDDTDHADIETSASGFKKLPISETMLDALKFVRYVEPTPIQAGVIPSVMKGIDVLGQAQTGTGKTAAFLIPLLEGIEECEPGNSPVALILVPTRELAVQVRDEAAKLSYGRDIRVTACYGGKPIAKNLVRLREGVDIIIGTPGRLLDLMKRGALSCNMLRWVVLDEADRMLDIGFRPDIEKILAKTPSDRQTLLFSATLPPQVVKLAKKYMIDPEILDFSTSAVAVETIEQYYITVDQMRKFDALVQLLKQEEPHQAIIFCRTKRGADRASRMLESRFDSIAAIHGDLAQPVRDRVMAQFRAGTLRYLVATDVVGRGIDVSGISHIINYDIPTFCDDYVHRVGRTGRMGREGVAFTFVTAEEGSELTRIEMRIDRLLKRAELKDFEAFAKPTDSTVVDPFGPAQGKPVFGKPVRKVRRAL